MSVMEIKSSLRDYTVHFVESGDFINDLRQRFAPRCFVVDRNVWELYNGGLLREITEDELILLPVDEERKTLETVQELYDGITKRQAKRNMTLISIGGGITQDITGFAASTLYRGINWVYVPTTLLAQADSCIGSKTSLNYKSYKNLIGTFYPPAEVYIAPDFLNTQNRIDYFSGLGEVLKLHLLGGREKVETLIATLPELLERNRTAQIAAVRSSLSIKQSYITEDEFDNGKRNLLNFGHCFGHALESTSNFAIPHGQAILIGMLLANIVAYQRGLLSLTTKTFVDENILLLGLVVNPSANFFAAHALTEAMKKDKKRVGEGLALIIMTEGYSFVRVNDLSIEEATNAANEFVNQQSAYLA